MYLYEGIIDRVRMLVLSLFHGRSNRTVGGAALVIAVFGVASRLLGFVEIGFWRVHLAQAMYWTPITLLFVSLIFCTDCLLLARSRRHLCLFYGLRERKASNPLGILQVACSCSFDSSRYCVGNFGDLCSTYDAGYCSGFSPRSRRLPRALPIGPVFWHERCLWERARIVSEFHRLSLAPVFYNVGIISGAVAKFFSGLAMALLLWGRYCMHVFSIRGESGFVFLSSGF